MMTSTATRRGNKEDDDDGGAMLTTDTRGRFQSFPLPRVKLRPESELAVN